MDVNGDGHIDVLSGCYSRHGSDMAGLFQVLRGKPDGTFRKAWALEGTDGKPLILPAGRGRDDVIDKICTRPFACDLDGDGKLDIVSGNFRGTFGFFRGEGAGRFRPTATWLQVGTHPMGVGFHSDPFLIDWDGDGDLDLLSGSSPGGVVLFPNVGTKTAPKFDAQVTLVKPAGHQGGETKFGDAHCTGPASDTRVWAADVDGNGKLDLLVGDCVTLYFKAADLDEATARAKDAAWAKRRDELHQRYPQGDDEEARREWQAEYARLHAEREKFVREQRTGFVWLFRQK